MAKIKSTFIILVTIAVLTVITGLAFLSVGNKTNPPPESKNDKIPDRLFKLKKGNLPIGFTHTGTINSRKKHKLALEAAFRTKLLEIVEENKKVKKGEILAKFETEELIEKLDNFKLELENVTKELEIANEEKRILQSSNKAEIKSAEDKLVESDEALRKYHRFEKHKTKDSHNIKVKQAMKKVDDAEAKYKEKLEETKQKSYKNKEQEDKAKKELKNLKQEFENETINHKNAVMDRKLYKRFEHPNKITKLDNSYQQAELDLNKVKIQTASKMIQKEKHIRNLIMRKKKYEKDLKKHEEFLEQMKLVSPVDGVVIYGDPDRYWRKIEIKIGMDIHRRQVLLTIPDMDKLIVEFELPEQYRSKIKIGDKAIITPDSMEHLKLLGKVSDIATLPVHRVPWDQTTPKIYKSSIELDKQNPSLVCGMSVQLEVITKVLKNVLFVPVEAIFDKEGKYFVYLKTAYGKPKQVYVDIGLSNDNNVHIKKGLKEGDMVYLYRPFERKVKN